MKDFVVGALVGSVIGAAAALMLAPKPGKELRGDVAVQAVSLKDKGVTLSTTAKEKTVELSNQLKDQSTQLVEKVKAKTAKGPAVIDDGTVSSEGEEPLENVEEVVEDLKEAVVDSIASPGETVKEGVEEPELTEEELIKAELEAEGQPENADPDLNK